MFARFFVNHPIFANVIAIVIMVVGVVSLIRLPVEQFPQITPPTIRVTTNYPGANAQVVADTVAAPIEQQINGVEGMMYMSSTSASDGSYGLTVTFEIGTDLNMAQVLVQNRVAIAIPQLPADVQKQGVVTKKQSTQITMFIASRPRTPTRTERPSTTTSTCRISPPCASATNSAACRASATSLSFRRPIIACASGWTPKNSRLAA